MKMKLRRIIFMFALALFFFVQFGCNNSEGQKGEKGDDGLTPYIGENGNWWIGDKDTLVKANGTQGEKGETGNPGTPGEPGDKGLSAYELYIKYNPYYKRTEEMWVTDLVEGKLAISSKKNSIEYLYELEEGFSFKTEGQIVYKTKSFVVVDDGSAKLLMKINDQFKYEIGDIISLNGSVVSNSNILLIDENANLEKVDSKKIDESYYDKFDDVDYAYYKENATIEYIKYVGKIGFDTYYFTKGNGAKLEIANPEDFENITEFKEKDVVVKGYLIGVNEKINLYATSIEERVYEIEKIQIKCEKSLYVGYNLSKVANVYPESAPQDVIWEIQDKRFATISEQGIIKGIKKGSIKVRAISKYDSTKASEWVEVNVLEISEKVDRPDYKGYEITIEAYRPWEIDPFYNKDGSNLQYENIDKKYKQEAWSLVEKNYNVKIKVVENEKSVPEVNYENLLKSYVKSGNSPVDIEVLPIEKLFNVALNDSIYDLTKLTDNYTYGEQNKAFEESVKFNKKFYGSQIDAYLDFQKGIDGLVYNYTWLKKLNIEDPANLYENGNWTYEKFAQWVKEVQSKLSAGEYVLQGHAFNYWLGMSYAAGVKVGNQYDYSNDIVRNEQIEASNLMYELKESNCISSLNKWSLTDKGENSFASGKTLMATGNLYNLKELALNNENTEYAYVPFPRPEYNDMEDMLIPYYNQYTYVYVKGRNYPTLSSGNKMTHEDVWKVMNEAFIMTKKYMQNDANFSLESELENELANYVDNPSSIKIISKLSEDKLVFDPINYVYASPASNPINKLAYNTMWEGEDYLVEAGSILQFINNDLLRYYRIVIYKIL